jgi:replicative superfamily II helicase
LLAKGFEEEVEEREEKVEKEEDRNIVAMINGDAADLPMQGLQSLIKNLNAIHHGRIKYPERQTAS